MQWTVHDRFVHRISRKYYYIYITIYYYHHVVDFDIHIFILLRENIIFIRKRLNERMLKDRHEITFTHITFKYALITRVHTYLKTIVI